MTLTATEAPLKRPLGDRVIGEDLLLQAGCDGVPLAVAQANEACREAWITWQGALAALRVAQDEHRHAPRLDVGRDALALEAGKRPPIDRLEAAAEVALETATRAELAARERVRDVEFEFVSTVRDHHAAWADAQGNAVIEARREAHERLHELAAALDRLTAAQSIEAALAEFPVSGGYYVAMRFRKQSPRERESARAQAAALVAGTGNHASTLRNADTMTAAIQYLIDR